MTKIPNLTYPNQALKKVSGEGSLGSNTDNSVVFKNASQNQEIKYTPFKAYFYRIHLRKLYNIKHPYCSINTRFEVRKKRISGCGCRPIETNKAIDVVKGEKGNVYLTNLQKCGSVWLCPVCLIKLNKHKLEWLKLTLDHHSDRKRKMSFNTLTIQHKRYHRLEDTMAKLKSIYKSVSENHRLKALKKEHKIEYIYTFEITYGGNGWHPHFHFVVVSKADKSSVKEYNQLFKSLYKKQIEKRGLLYNEGKTIVIKSVSNDEDISDYMTKQNAIYEITSNQNKKSFKKGKNYLELISDYIDNGVDHRKALLEYSDATHKARQHQASRNFTPKHLKRMSSKTEQEILRDDKVDYIIGTLTTAQMRYIILNEIEDLFLTMIQEKPLNEVMDYFNIPHLAEQTETSYIQMRGLEISQEQWN
tara:strand:- start:520 stop:1770 length:1251 start_codon:yes stop_codon:yes gene_type:complete